MTTDEFRFPNNYYEFYGDIFDHFESRLRGHPRSIYQKAGEFLSCANGIR